MPSSVVELLATSLKTLPLILAKKTHKNLETHFALSFIHVSAIMPRLQVVEEGMSVN